MCGIYLGEEQDEKIMKMVANRGKNIQKTVIVNNFVLFSSVLSIRDKIEQPVCTEKFSFLYNGEIYNEAVSDTMFIKETVELVLSRYKYDHTIKYDLSIIQEISMEIYLQINNYENELALVILFRDFVVFFKDDIGRKSLGFKLNRLQISSVGYQNEIDCLNIHIYDIKQKKLHTILKQSDYVCQQVAKYHRIAHMVKKNELYNFLNFVKFENSVEYENEVNTKCSEHNLDKLIIEATKKRLVEGNIVVLFSGGIDSNVIVLYLLLTSKNNQKTFLINSSLSNSQDRENAKISYEKFKKLFTERFLELIIVELDCEMIRMYRKHLENLIYPKTSKMDLNIAVVLYFAAKKAREYSKVCFLGSGADEIFCGYNKYKDDDFRDKMFFDLFTISYHNTTRDDRCISDNNIEPRFPFLDTNVIKSSYFIENEEIKNKNILRKILSKYGLEDLSTFKKVAMQYGSGINKIEKYLYS